MDLPPKRIAVVGGGFAGIVCIGTLKEVGLEPICFEMTDTYGGTWNYREKTIDGLASIMPTVSINHSKELGAFSIFPPRKEFSNFMRHHELLQYMKEYATEYDLLRYIIFNMEVIHVEKSEDYKLTGQWKVTVRHTKTGMVTSDFYNGVLIAVGHLNRPKMPKYIYQEEFQGRLMHTHSLKEVTEFKGKNVVVIGMGCSGLDAAVEISSVAKQVYISTRGGGYVFNRVGRKGYPYDAVLLTRFKLAFLNILPINLVSWILESVFVDSSFDSKLYAVEPRRRLLMKDPAVNDFIASKLLSGSVIQKQAMERFTKRGVVFKGDPAETEADIVLMATGYTWKFPFLEEGILECNHENGIINLFKCMFPPQLPKSNLAFIGFILPFGPGFPVGEIQCRWAAHILAGKDRLPSITQMYKDITDRHFKNLKRYGACERSSIRVDNIIYMDDIASQFGVKPNLLKLLFTDIRLFWKIMFGPFLSYQYRLQGPFAWEGAREAIMSSSNRTLWPLKQTDDFDISENVLILFTKKY